MTNLKLIVYARYFVILWFLGGGLGHFVATDFFVGITPAWVPNAREVVWISGVFELAGAVGLMLPRFRVAAGWGLLLLTLAVSPANIQMAMNPEMFPDFPPILLYLRLLVQLFLLACIVWGAGLFNRGEAK
ncbi:MAG: hypothetical protein QE278_11565 [Limnobacter sp.]|nr:hypothetical protein [Limnobacter sp.]